VTTDAATLTVIVPVYKNEDSLAELVDEVAKIFARLALDCRFLFVIDGSPDRSAEVLRSELQVAPYPSTLIVLSRNFGSFAAIRAGLEHASGEYFAVLAADLQEPPELLESFVDMLDTGEYDLVLGERRSRADSLGSRITAATFWGLYRRFVQPDMPKGGVDVFACNAVVRSAILELHEANTSLVGQLLWVGFRRTTVQYDRRPRKTGKSAWTFAKKMRYMTDSIFAFTDLPIRALLTIGVLGCLATAAAAVVVFVCWLVGLIDEPGYTPLMLAVLGVGAVVTLGLGIVGSYLWRTFENTKGRPLTVEQSIEHFPGP
jgi:polyisoprenyl-phosphate glycosyltransferase